MRRFGISAIVASTSGGQLKALNSEGQVLIIGIVDQETVVDGLLQALGFVALRDQGASRSGGGALFDAGGLGQGLVVGLDVVDHDAPLAVNVDGPQGLDVAGLRGAQVGFLDDLLQPVDGVVGVGQHVLVHLLHRVVVVLDGLLDLVGGVLGVLKAPGLGVTGGAFGLMVRLGMVNGVVGSGVMRGRVVRGGMMGHMVWDGSIGVWVVGVRVVWGGAVWHW